MLTAGFQWGVYLPYAFVYLFNPMIAIIYVLLNVKIAPQEEDIGAINTEIVND